MVSDHWSLNIEKVLEQDNVQHVPNESAEPARQQLSAKREDWRDEKKQKKENQRASFERFGASLSGSIVDPIEQAFFLVFNPYYYRSKMRVLVHDVQTKLLDLVCFFHSKKVAVKS